MGAHHHRAPKAFDVKGSSSAGGRALQFTRHGPVIHVDLEPAARIRRAHGLERARQRSLPGQPGLSGLCTSVAGVRSASLEHWSVPANNHVVADAQGRDRPGSPRARRRYAMAWDGLLPVPGDGRYEWRGFHPARRCCPTAMRSRSQGFRLQRQRNEPAARCSARVGSGLRMGRGVSRARASVTPWPSLPGPHASTDAQAACRTITLSLPATAPVRTAATDSRDLTATTRDAAQRSGPVARLGPPVAAGQRGGVAVRDLVDALSCAPPRSTPQRRRRRSGSLLGPGDLETVLRRLEQTDEHDAVTRDVRLLSHTGRRGAALQGALGAAMSRQWRWDSAAPWIFPACAVGIGSSGRRQAGARGRRRTGADRRLRCATVMNTQYRLSDGQGDGGCELSHGAGCGCLGRSASSSMHPASRACPAMRTTATMRSRAGVVAGGDYFPAAVLRCRRRCRTHGDTDAPDTGGSPRTATTEAETAPSSCTP